MEPLASATVDELVAAIGPTVQRYLTGDVGSGPAVAAVAGPSGEEGSPGRPQM